ncbi:MAG: class I SAM-dependent methyltransferase [Actinomycetota bacterium]|nr:class I SAM-dependent methyltransferase [Actinomycetota bacterium]
MSLMDRVFAGLYPRLIKSSEEKWLRAHRARVLGEVSGAVVEIGAGSGLNLEHYTSSVTSLVLTEPNPHLISRLREAASRLNPEAEIVETPADSLPGPDGSADFVVSTLVLCSVPDVAGVLGEIKRVLKPDGGLVLLEHVRGEGRVENLQRYLEPITKIVGRGCHVTRETRAELEAAGFDTSEVQDVWVEHEPKIYGPHIVGTAKTRTSSASSNSV